MQRNLHGLQLVDSSHVLLSRLNTEQQAVIRKVAVSVFHSVRKQSSEPSAPCLGAALRLQPYIASNCKY